MKRIIMFTEKSNSLLQPKKCLPLLLLLLSAVFARAADKPNMIFILADDMGYGDVADAGGKIATPNCDRLAAEGMRFTDAHTTSSVCTPTSYGTLTGRYNWRSRRKKGAIHHSINGSFAMRHGNWKLILAPGSGGWSLPKDREAIKKGLPKWQLYDITADPKETMNLVNDHPEKVKELTAILQKFIEDGRSTPGAPQKNHNGEIRWSTLPWDKDGKISYESGKS